MRRDEKKGSSFPKFKNMVLTHFDLQAVAEQIPLLVQGVRGSQAQPDSPSAQLALIAASQSFLQARHSPLLRPRPSSPFQDLRSPTV